MRAVSLHHDVLVVTSAVLHVNCVVVRGGAGAEQGGAGEGSSPVHVIEPGQAAAGEGETFVIDSPVLPDELDALPALLEQAGFPPATGLLATHADWDHLLGRLAFPGLALGCAESSARRLAAEPGGAQRELRGFDEELMIPRGSPLSLGSVQGLPVPGRCEIGSRELELHATGGHTEDGMALLADWAGVLIAGDYLSAVELPALNPGGSLDSYEATLTVLEPLLERAAHAVPGHGPVLDAARARAILAEDRDYIEALRERGAQAPLPAGRDGHQQRELHRRNAEAVR